VLGEEVFARHLEKFKAVKEQSLKKVQIAIQGEELRVSSPSKDNLQEVITFLRGQDSLVCQCPLKSAIRACALRRASNCDSTFWRAACPRRERSAGTLPTRKRVTGIL
jgi:hypothetical protein